MLPLHSTLSTFSVFLLLFLTSCSDKSNSDIAVIEALEEGIQFSNRSIAQSTEDVMFSLREKLNAGGTNAKASIWYPKAQKVQEVSKSAFDFIEAIKTKISDKNEPTVSKESVSRLFDRLIEYKSNLLQIDSNITRTFADVLIVFNRSFDSIGKSQEDLYQTFFNNISVKNSKLFLNHIQNNICVNEQKMITFCNEQIAILSLIYIPSPLVTQSSSIVNPNETIEIAAGIACYDKYSKPKVLISDSPIPLSSAGIAYYKFKAAPKSGKYFVPIKINYNDLDGIRRTFETSVKYTVVNIQEQE